jgi:hypothetical protein
MNKLFLPVQIKAAWCGPPVSYMIREYKVTFHQFNRAWNPEGEK